MHTQLQSEEFQFHIKTLINHHICQNINLSVWIHAHTHISNLHKLRYTEKLQSGLHITLPQKKI